MAEYIDREEIEKKARYRKELGFPCVDVIDIHETPTANVTPIPDGATNGDVIKALFPTAKTWEVTRDDVHCAYIEFKDICEIKSFPLSWWNAPYKKGVEK